MSFHMVLTEQEEDGAHLKDPDPSQKQAPCKKKNMFNVLALNLRV